MPYAIKPNKDGTVKVINSQTGQVHARRTSKARAEAQVRLLRAREHGWTPSK